MSAVHIGRNGCVVTDNGITHGSVSAFRERRRHYSWDVYVDVFSLVPGGRVSGMLHAPAVVDDFGRLVLVEPLQ